MIQMNVGDHSGSENGDNFTPVPNDRRWQVRRARRKLFQIARDLPGADVYFRSLPGGRSFTNLINDNSIWMNYDATNGDFGFTYGNNDLWICERSFRIGWWTVLATIVHELAHINGADGAGRDAELAVFHCGLGRRSERTTGVDDPFTPYDPTITG